MKQAKQSEYVRARNGLEVCPECGLAWTLDGPGHRPDCRFFYVEEVVDDWEEEEVALQLSLFRPAA